MASSAAKDHHHVAVATQHGPGFSSSGAQPVEDESCKKNTDCVYFLASPLTCKKGSECEYRHSEFARVNPRDCWYWLNGSCLNPKCSFRHPPLDTLKGTPTDSSAGSSKPVSSSAAVGSSLLPPYAVPSAPYTAAKPTAPCIFFQKGYCLKADRCPFFHVQNPASNKAPDHPAANVSESSRFNSASGALQKCSQLKFAPQANMPKPIEAVPQQLKTGVQPVLRNGAFVEKRGMPQHNVSNQDLPKHSVITSRSLNNGSSRNKTVIASQASVRDDQRFQISKEGDDLQRESSPGFDVLVDDELGDADYFGNDVQFSRTRGHEGREPGEFESGRPDHYHSLDDFDPVTYHDRRGYDGYKPMQERRSRDSSERPIIEGSHHDRRVGNSDLRQRLSKQRRTNGLTSVVNPDYPSDNHGEESRYRSSRRESRHTPPRGSSVSIGSRLQGRIKLPGQPSPVNPPIMHSEREYDKGRNHSRLSPNRPQLQSHRVRVQDRLRGKVQDDVGREAAAPRRDVFDYNRSEFAAPKSLAELRKSKEPHSQSRELPKRSDEFSSLGKRKSLESSLNSEDSLSFDAPKPLSEILKRKRKAEDTNSHSGTATVAEVGKNTKNKTDAANVEEQNKLSMPSELEENNPVVDESKADISQANDVFESEEGLVTDGVEVDNELGEEYYEEGEYEDDQEGEGYTLEEGEEYTIEEGEGGEGYNLEEGENGGEGYNLEEGENGGEGYNLEEGENGELPEEEEEEYMDEDDADSFAKKIGVIFS